MHAALFAWALKLMREVCFPQNSESFAHITPEEKQKHLSELVALYQKIPHW